MAKDIGSNDSSERDTDGEAEEQPSREPLQQEADEDNLHENEDAPIRLQRNPADPLPEERARHWKRIFRTVRGALCVKARGREDQHRARKNKDEGGITDVAMD